MTIRKAKNRRRDRKSMKSCKSCGSEMDGILMFKRCPDCRSLKIATLAETGEKYCKACGLVLL